MRGRRSASAVRLPLPRAHGGDARSGWRRTSRCRTAKASPSRIVVAGGGGRARSRARRRDVAGARLVRRGRLLRPAAGRGRGASGRARRPRDVAASDRRAVRLARGARARRRDRRRRRRRLAARSCPELPIEREDRYLFLRRADRASGCSSRSSSRPSAASPRSSSPTGACSRATSARAATPASDATAWRANVRAGDRGAAAGARRTSPSRCSSAASTTSRPTTSRSSARSTTGSTSPRASAATGS